MNLHKLSFFLLVSTDGSGFGHMGLYCTNTGKFSVNYRIEGDSCIDDLYFIQCLDGSMFGYTGPNSSANIQVF